MSLSIIDKDKPNPTTLTTLRLRVRGLLDADGKPYDLSGVTKFYAHIKDALSDPDASADVKLDSETNPTQFITTYAATGNLDIIFTTANTTLTAGTLYYIDVAAVWPDGTKIVLVNDTITFTVPPTLAVT